MYFGTALTFVYILLSAVQLSVNKQEGWHSDERWPELIITCSVADISKFILVYALIFCGLSFHCTCNYVRKQLCFQRVLAIAILSVRLSVRPSVRLSITRVDQAKTVQARISKSSPSAAWKTLVSGTVKLLHKFDGGHPERGH